MDSHTVLANLHSALAALYSDVASATRVVDDSGVNSLRIAFTSHALNNWHEILNEAVKQERLDALLKVALDEYSDNRELREACDAYFNFVAQGGRIRTAHDGLETGADAERQMPWWNAFPQTYAGGDVIIATVGAGAKNVAVGKNITQRVYEALGTPTEDDEEAVRSALNRFRMELTEKQAALDEVKQQIAEFQFNLLKTELSKPEADGAPAASTLVQVGDWLLDNIPGILDAMTSLFATPAVGRVVGRSGESVVGWLKQRLGSP